MTKKPSRVTLATIAEELSLSPATVSRALNGKAKQFRISADTVARIEALAAELGFFPNYAARSLRTQKTSTIGVIVPDISNPFFAAVTQAITTTAGRSGFSTLLCDSQDSVAMEVEALRLIESRFADGIILCPIGTESAHVVDYVSRNPAMVLVDRNLKEVSAPFVGSDNFTGAKEATEYLIRQGHERILCLRGIPGTTPSEERHRGYQTALQEYGLPYDKSLVSGNHFGEQSGYMETKMHLSLNTKFTAIFAMGNMIAMGAIKALGEAGLRIPDEVSMIAFDDSPFAPYLATPLTSVRQQAAEVATMAVQLLLQHIGEGDQRKGVNVLLPTKLIHRSSVRSLSTEEGDRTD
ncbi:MAG: LacI family DNA-binding transcriptional regulator [Planctomycetia bacterium]|jgi:LacI family transcriptional regulator